MRLIYSQPELLDAELPPEVMPADLERFWREQTAPLAKRLLRLSGVNGRVPFVLRGGSPGDRDVVYDDDLSHVFRKMAGQVPGRTTMETYGRHVFNLLAAMEVDGQSLETASAAYLADYKRRRATSILPTSWNSEAAAIKAMFDVVVLIGIRPDNPCSHPNLVWMNKGASIEPEEPKFITLEQYRRFREEGLMRSRAPLRNAGFADMLITSGMRLWEGTNFQRTSLPDEPEKTRGRAFTYRVPADDAKGGRSRKVPIAISAFQTMRDYAAIERSTLLERWSLVDPGTMWLNQSGEPISESGWEYVFAAASKRSGVEVTPHTLRHTFAVYMLSALLRQAMRSGKEAHEAARALTAGDRRDVYASIFGDPLRKLQKLLGHKHYETTFIYLDVLSASDHAIDEALAIFDEAFGSEEDYLDLCA